MLVAASPVVAWTYTDILTCWPMAWCGGTSSIPEQPIPYCGVAYLEY